MKLMIAKANRKNSGEIWEKHLGAWTGRVDISKEIIPGSRSSIHGYILTYSSLSRKKSPRAHLHMVGMLQFIPDINQPSLPTLFYSILVSLLSSWPFQLYFILQLLPTTLRSLTLFFWSYLCLIGPFNYKSLYESLLQRRYYPLGVDCAQNTN